MVLSRNGGNNIGRWQRNKEVLRRMAIITKLLLTTRMKQLKVLGYKRKFNIHREHWKIKKLNYENLDYMIWTCTVYTFRSFLWYYCCFFSIDTLAGTYMYAQHYMLVFCFCLSGIFSLCPRLYTRVTISLCMPKKKNTQ